MSDADLLVWIMAVPAHIFLNYQNLNSYLEQVLPISSQLGKLISKSQDFLGFHHRP